MDLKPLLQLKPSSEEDYCTQLKLGPCFLGAAFSHSNTVQLYSLDNLEALPAVQLESGSLSEFTFISENTFAWCDKAGSLGVFDLREGKSRVQRFQEEWFSMDACGFNLAASSNKGMTVWDLRTMSEKRKFSEVHADHEDVTCVRFNPDYSHILVSCAEDNLMSICNVESQEEDPYILMSVEEPGLKVGFVGPNIYCVTISRYWEYQPNLDDDLAPPLLVKKLSAFELQETNPEANYFISSLSLGVQEQLLVGSHQRPAV